MYCLVLISFATNAQITMITRLQEEMEKVSQMCKLTIFSSSLIYSCKFLRIRINKLNFKFYHALLEVIWGMVL